MLYPVRIQRFSLRENSGGIGKFRGGWGGIVEIGILAEEATATIMGERAEFAPKGLFGGQDGTKDEVYVVRENGRTEKPAVGTKGRFVLRKGDVLALRTFGGGRYGNPLARERELILKDIVNELVSVGEAESAYKIGSVAQKELDDIRQKM